MKLHIAEFAKPAFVICLISSFFTACTAFSPDEQDVLSSDEHERQVLAAVEAQEMKVEQAIETEKEDPEWSQRAVTSWIQIFHEEAMKEELKGIQLGNIECRTTICRMEVIPTDAAQGVADFEQDIGELMLFAPWQASVFGKIENPDGRVPVAVLYMAREGHSLP